MAGAQYVYVMKGLTKAWPGEKPILADVWLSFLPGAKIGVLGYNGAGKSSLLRIMAGEDKAWDGEARVADGTRIGYLPQEPALDPDRDVRGNVLDGVADTLALLDDFNSISARFAEPMSDDAMNALIERQGELQNRIDAADAWNLDRQIDIAMDALCCPPGDSPVDKLSGGERRRVALARLLLSRPDMLLLDEPTNHLDADSVAWLERYLAEFPGTVVAVTHDRYFLDNVAGWILELDRGRGLPFEGNYTAWLTAREKRLAQEEREESARQRTIRHELAWIRQSPRARQAKSRARINAYDELVARSGARAREMAQITIAPGPRLGNLVIAGEGLHKGFDGRTLMAGLDFSVPPGAIVGIIGENGAGKTTLFRMITGQDTPDAGRIRCGDTVRLGYVDQSRDSLTPDRTVWEEIADGQDTIRIGERDMASRAYVAGFNFKGSSQQKPVGQLSGGERNRVHLAKMLKSGANVLLLDEPTNDLDVDTLRALEDAIAAFPGCVLVISHDRWFLDRLATHILAFEGDGQVTWFEGNYADYEADRQARLGDSAGRRFRRLT